MQCGGSVVANESVLLPHEIMGCGVPVVSNRAEESDQLLDDDIAMLANPTIGPFPSDCRAAVSEA
ncbi:hypothetical protein EMIT0P294_50139 [Pseudomonas sp. IT-P294]